MDVESAAWAQCDVRRLAGLRVIGRLGDPVAKRRSPGGGHAVADCISSAHDFDRRTREKGASLDSGRRATEALGAVYCWRSGAFRGLNFAAEAGAVRER